MEHGYSMKNANCGTTSVRVTATTYATLKKLKQSTGLPIQRLAANAVDALVASMKSKGGAK